MSTPASFDQVDKFVKDALGDPDSNKMQHLLANSRHFRELAFTDFSKVDWSAYDALLAGRLTYQPLQPVIPWTPVNQYVARIMARSKSRGWGFTQADANKLAAKLHDHDGPLTPTGVSIWLGKNLEFNWAEMMAWLEDEVKALGVPFKAYFEPDRLSFYKDCEQSGKRKLGVVDLDLATFWNPTNGVIPRDVRTSRSKWPGLEVPALLALNPQVYVAMDGETIPYMFAPGVVVGSVHLPGFSLDSGEACVDGDWDGSQWHGTSMVAFSGVQGS